MSKEEVRKAKERVEPRGSRAVINEDSLIGRHVCGEITPVASVARSNARAASLEGDAKRWKDDGGGIRRCSPGRRPTGEEEDENKTAFAHRCGDCVSQRCQKIRRLLRRFQSSLAAALINAIS